MKYHEGRNVQSASFRIVQGCWTFGPSMRTVISFIVFRFRSQSPVIGKPTSIRLYQFVIRTSLDHVAFFGKKHDSDRVVDDGSMKLALNGQRKEVKVWPVSQFSSGSSG